MRSTSGPVLSRSVDDARSISATLAEAHRESVVEGSEPVVDDAPRNSGSPATVRLTPAESRVLGLLPTHLTLAAIGDRLGSSRSTVKTHVAHIYAKLAVTSRGAAVERAGELGMLRPPGSESLFGPSSPSTARGPSRK